MRKYRRGNIHQGEYPKIGYANINFLELLELVRGIKLNMLKLDTKSNKSDDISVAKFEISELLDEFPKQMFIVDILDINFFEDYFNTEISTKDFYEKYKKYAIIRED